MAEGGASNARRQERLPVSIFKRIEVTPKTKNNTNKNNNNANLCFNNTLNKYFKLVMYILKGQKWRKNRSLEPVTW